MSNAGSEDFGHFLEENDDSEQRRKLNLNGRRNRDRGVPALAFATPSDAQGRAFQLPEPTAGSLPFRIRTRRPINLRIAPPPDTSQIPDDVRPLQPLNATDHQRPEAPAFRIFTREQVRNFEIPRPPSSVLSGRSNVTPDNTTNNFTVNNALRWRLRGLRGDSASFTEYKVPEESDRFTLGSFKGSADGSGTGGENTTAGIRRALDSQYVLPRSKRPKQSGTRPSTSKILGELRDEPEDRIQADTRSMDSEPGEGSNVEAPDLEASDEAAAPNLEVGNESFPTRLNGPPSRVDSDRDSDRGPIFVENRLPTVREESDQEDQGSASDSDSGRLRPRGPHEIEGPLIFDVPISEMPNIDWGADDVDVDGQFLEQQLEHSESESDEESDAGSVAEMIDDSSDDDNTYLNNSTEAEKEWVPDPSSENSRRTLLSDEDSSDDGEYQVEALTESEGEEDASACIDSDAEVVETVASARQNRGKRNRIPTVRFWLGERIEYERTGKRELMTAIDVHRVEPPQKTYRRRRLHRVRRAPRTQIFDDVEATADQQEVMVPIFDTKSKEWRDRTVARSIAGLDFVPVMAPNGSRIPMVTRCVLFGGKQDSAPLRLSVLRIEPGGVFSSGAEQNRACTFVVWRGKCTVHLNNHEFDLMKGMACLVPRGNDFFVDNGGGNGGDGERISTGDVYLFITEINAEANPDLADAMARDAQSMISGAAAISNFFESENGSEAGGGGSSVNDDAAEDISVPPQEMASIDEAGMHGEEGSDAVDSNETRETFGHGFARALRSNSEASSAEHHAPSPALRGAVKLARPTVQAVPPPESFRSLSMALGSDKEHAMPSRRTYPVRPAVPPPQPEQDFDTFDMLNDYLEGRKGNPRRLVLNERPAVDREDLRVRAYLDTLAENQSNLSNETSH